MPLKVKEVMAPGACPYVAAIHGGFTTGKCLKIKGNIPADLERFSVNLQTGPSTKFDDEIALHVNPRFPEQVIVRNTKSGGEWGSEERDGPLPLMAGEDFEMVITNDGESYKIEVMGEALPGYSHRLPAERVSHLAVHEDVSLSTVECEKCKECTTPFVDLIEGGFGPGRSVRIKGVISASVDRMEVNLQCGPDRDNDDLALHVNPRFDDEVVVRNSKSGGDWGSEEREGALVLTREEEFDITITNEGSTYKIETNGEHLGNFDHRLPGECVAYLSVIGDLELTLLEYH